DAFWRGRVREGVEHLEELEGAVTFSAERRRQDGPERSVSVLRAVLSDARQISLDVAGIVRRLVERRGQEHQEPGVLADQVLLERAHRLGLPRRVAGA